MKLNELNWTNGNQYLNLHTTWTVDGDELVDQTGIDIHYSHTLKEVSEMNFVEITK